MKQSSTKKNTATLIGILLIVTALVVGIIVFVSKGIKNKENAQANNSSNGNGGNDTSYNENNNQKLALFNSIIGFGRDIFGAISSKKNKNKNNSGDGKDAIVPKPEPKSNNPVEDTDVFWV